MATFKHYYYSLIFFSLTLIINVHSTTPTASSSAQPSLAQAPSPQPPASDPPASVPLVQAPPAAKSRRRPGLANVTDILEKAGGFSVFVRLLRSTDVITQIENDLNASNSVTVLAPSNGGFSALRPGTLNVLSPQQKTQLVDFHVLPTFIALQNFQTLTNPVRTQATNPRDFPLNVTTDGSSVNFSTGVVNTSISGTIYADDHLAIYRVDSVLLPLKIFAPDKVSSPAPAPAPAVLKKPKKETSDTAEATTAASASSESAAPSPTEKPPTLSTSASGSGSEGQADATDASGVIRSTAWNDVVYGFGVALIAVVFGTI